MPTSYRIDPLQALVRARAWGVLTNAELRDHYHELVADPLFRPAYSQLTDLAEVTQFVLQARVIAEVASWPITIAGTRRAMVAASEVGFGLSRMFSIRAEYVGQNVVVFRTEAEAMDWLNAPNDPAREQYHQPACDARIMAA
jgi:hypothetical protein